MKIIDFIRPKIQSNQFGFQQYCACLSQLLSSYWEAFLALDEGNYCDIIFLDFSKAFEAVPHNEPLQKLWAIGITGSLWHWFQNYLTNRYHYVCIDGESSQLLPVLSGVPQGSILGPMFFLVYINDLPNTISHATPYLLADDTKLLKSISIHNDSLILQHDIDTLAVWSRKWNLPLNQHKSVAMRLTLKTHPDPPQYTIKDSNMIVLSNHKDLGIVIDNKLSWSAHYPLICINAYRALNFVRRIIGNSVPIQLKRSLCLTLVRSKATYCSQLWRPRLIKDITSLENIQRRSSKYIPNNYTMDYKQRLITLDILPLMYHYELQDLLYLIKQLKQPQIYKYVPFALFKTSFSQHHKLSASFSRTSSVKHFYFHRIVTLWNSLPHIDLDQPLITIKHQIQTYLWMDPLPS